MAYFSLCWVYFEEVILKKKKGKCLQYPHIFYNTTRAWIPLAYLSMVLLRVQDNYWFISFTLLAPASGLSYKNLFVSLSFSLTLVGSGPGRKLYVHLCFLFWDVILLWLYFYSKVTCFTPIIGDRKAISENLVSSLLPEVWYVFSDCVFPSGLLHEATLAWTWHD